MHIESIMSECKNAKTTMYYILYTEGQVNVYVYIIRLCIKLQNAYAIFLSINHEHKPRAQHRDQLN